MHRLKLLLLGLSLFWLSCNNETHPKTVAGKNSAFNLETVLFKEDIPALFSKRIMIEDGFTYDSARDGQLTDSMLRYRISNTMTDAMKIKVPQQEFGYRYRSPETDSIARFGNMYFRSLSVLTDLQKKPVAYYADTELPDVKLRKAFLDELIKKYGAPKYSWLISSEFNHCSYEWQLTDRIIQIETSNGMSVSFMSGDTAARNNKYYNLEILIVETSARPAIHAAHIYEFPDKILYDGKLHSYKDFQFEKKQIFSDRFLLNSTNERYVKDEFGEFDINRAETEE